MANVVPDKQALSEENLLEVQGMSEDRLKRRSELYPDNRWGKYLWHYGPTMVSTGNGELET